VTWRELAGDGRLAKALEACEENGWEGVPLTRLFPDLWEAKKAAGAGSRRTPRGL
jgi:hypothetical protein